MKTIDQIRQQFDDIAKKDIIGFKREVLGAYLKEQYKPEHVDSVLKLSEDVVIKELLSYLDFAFGKAINHRWISAGRSVEKLATMAWVLDRKDLLEFAENENNYPMYGVPVLKRFAQAFDVIPPQEIINWADGESCTPNCNKGC